MQKDRVGNPPSAGAFGTPSALGCSQGKAACTCHVGSAYGLSGTRHCTCGWAAAPASLGVQGTGEPECISRLHGLCTRGDVTPPGTGSGGSSLGSCAGHGVELRSGCFAFPASAHAAFLCWSYAEKLRFMYCMKKTKQKKRKNPNVPK